MSSGNEALLKLAELFKILGDPTRLKIVELLLENEMCVNHIAETMGMGQSAISHQLRVLRQARLVTYRKEGKTAFYSLNDNHVEGLVRMGMEHVSHQELDIMCLWKNTIWGICNIHKREPFDGSLLCFCS